jgi:hypothetical protein
MLAIASQPSEPLATGPQPLALQLGPLDADNASLDLLALSALGQLTTALGAGDGRWQSVHTTDLGLGPLAGLKLTNFDSDAYLDLVLQGPNSISIARGDGSGQFTPYQTITPGTPGSLAPAGGAPLRMDASLINGDLLTDLVTVAPGTNEVLVFWGAGTGLLPLPARYASGATQPIAVVVGDFVAGPTPDLAVAHADGTLTLLEGDGQAAFQLRPESTVTGLGTIADLTAADLDGDGDRDLAVSGTGQLTLLLNDNDLLTTSPLANGDFSQGLTGWQTHIVGHAPAAGQAAGLQR